MATSRRKKKSGSKRKIFRIAGIVLLVLVLFLVFKVFGPNTGAFTQGDYVYIRTGSSYDEVKTMLKEEGFVRDLTSFDLLAKRAGYPQRVRAGKYKIGKGMSNFNIIRLLRSGKQTPVKLVIKKLRTKADFIRMVGSSLEADPVLLQHIMTDSVFLAQYGLDSNTAMCAIMPDTYEFYWNTDAEKVFRKIAKKYSGFWNDNRKQRARKLSLSPQEVITLASIVEEESNKNDEKPEIASVYLNRIRKGMRLQADPTARFAYGDFMIKRITSVQTSYESPYNTYKVEGLPPGPICTPSEKSIDAVLKGANTNYLYFCAREDFSGYHNFAATLKEHSENARKYHQALNARGIR
jgi:UPF0755 protein